MGRHLEFLVWAAERHLWGGTGAYQYAFLHSLLRLELVSEAPPWQGRGRRELVLASTQELIPPQLCGPDRPLQRAEAETPQLRSSDLRAFRLHRKTQYISLLIFKITDDFRVRD